MLLFSLYAHANPFPALHRQWHRPEALAPASSVGGWQLVRIDGQARTLSQVALDVQQALAHLDSLGVLGSGSPATLTITDPDGPEWEWQLAEDTPYGELSRMLAAAGLGD